MERALQNMAEYVRFNIIVDHFDKNVYANWAMNFKPNKFVSYCFDFFIKHQVPMVTSSQTDIIKRR